MFLPVLFIRDYGGWGWVLFAVPNIVGAAAMGWALRDADASRTMQQAHGAACGAFSLVTLAFHAYFIIGVLPRLMGNDVVWLTAVLVPPLVLLLRRRGATGRRATVTASVVLGISVLAMLAVLALGGMPRFEPPAADRNRIDLLWLAPVTIFGFLLDPYLDLTFHRARQSTTRAGGRTAFGLGFGVFFLLMIVFTAIYAPPMMKALAQSGPRLSPRQDLFAGVLLVHIAMQSAFTIAAHLDALRDDPPGNGATLPPRRGWIVAVVAVCLLAVPLRYLVNRFPAYDGLSTAEVIYRLFIAFYGLVFPAYVWLFVVPRRARGGGRVATQAPTGGQVLFYLAVLVLVAPMFWMSFIDGKMIWAVPGLLGVVVARFLLPKPPKNRVSVPAAASSPQVP